MSQISAADVKRLRESTGAGMMDCKKVLTETGGDFDAAVDLLRKKGLAAAAKKAGRVAAEGMVVAIAKDGAGVVLEVNSETDFVSKNEKFQAYVNELAEFILASKPADVDALNAAVFKDGLTVAESLSQLIATIGENMSIRRFHVTEANVVSGYVHGAGKIGVLIGINGENNDAMNELARGIAMHVAAVNPQFVRRSEVSEDAVAREKAVLTDRAAASGKPANIIEKIVDGQMAKFYSEVCLLEQGFVLDNDLTVGKALAKVQADAELTDMVRFQLGEGIEKEEVDFAAEVAAQVKG